MKASLGYGASTCSYADWIGTDLIVFFGSNVANNQPVSMKYLDAARRRGTKVAVVNPCEEPGMKRYWVPSVPESALFGTKISDAWFPVQTGGDLAFLLGVFRILCAEGWIDREFIDRSTSGFDEARAAAERLDPELLARESGTTPADMLRFARMLAGARNAVFVWSMGLTQHGHGTETVGALIDIGLARHYVGREKNGLMPIARLVAYGIAAVEPGMFGLGPVPAVKQVLARANWKLGDIDRIEINEAFAAIAIAVQRELGLPEDIVNVEGGAIAHGHPIGATGAILTTRLLHAMQRDGLKRGVVALCIGGGQGIALALENLR